MPAGPDDLTRKGEASDRASIGGVDRTGGGDFFGSHSCRDGTPTADVAATSMPGFSTGRRGGFEAACQRRQGPAGGDEGTSSEASCVAGVPNLSRNRLLCRRRPFGAGVRVVAGSRSRTAPWR